MSDATCATGGGSVESSTPFHGPTVRANRALSVATLVPDAGMM